jgi:hypothetical protein
MPTRPEALCRLECRLEIARAQRKQLLRQQADRRAREHLERLSLGIKDNLYGLNGR